MHPKQLRRWLALSIVILLIPVTACGAITFRTEPATATVAAADAQDAPTQPPSVLPTATPDDFGGGPIELPQDATTDAQIAAMQAEVDRNIAQLIDEGQISMQTADPVRFRFPLRAADNLSDYSFYGVSGFMDHNPTIGSTSASLQDYTCGTRTYDITGYNHQGTDYFTYPYPWYKMDYSQVEIIAAAPGTLVFKRDGGYDRQCAMTGALSNAVVIRHADGTLAHYLHMKEGSVTSKGVGAAIAVGEYLGVVGSSGSSTGPHLHFEVRDASNAVVDPFEGACNDRPSMWAEQLPYYDSAVIAVHTGSAPPYRPPCPGQETTNTQDAFDPDDEITFVTTYRDQRAGQTSTYRIIRPNGTVYDTWTHASTAQHYTASYWYWKRTLDGDGPPPEGTWRFEVAFEGETYHTLFTVGEPGLAPTPTATPSPTPTPTLTPTMTPTPTPSTITVTHPNGGEAWSGTVLPIVWDYEDNTTYVSIDLYKGGALEMAIVASTRNDGVHFWGVPGDLAPGRDYTIRISQVANPADTDGSDGPFTLAPVPTAGFTHTPSSGPYPLEVTFSDTSTSLIDTWQWDFGDGITGTDQHPAHTYAGVGTYTVALAVTGPTGSDSVTRTNAVTVTLPPLTADFSGTPVRGRAPLTVTFVDRSGGPVIHQRLWDFGDGGTSVLKAPTHIYAENGVYTVTLSVATADEADVLVRPGYIRVTDMWDLFLPTIIR